MRTISRKRSDTNTGTSAPKKPKTGSKAGSKSGSRATPAAPKAGPATTPPQTAPTSLSVRRIIQALNTKRIPTKSRWPVPIQRG
ncbi:hypothetical protein PHISCL_08442 [Aspergillus sclerotialis]|uniref:Uncharacterized protein n=1 Tax=Aspergillus sclerotialis TaxID=2070753 RepID=A0A3A2ZD38_9EURO|nr:hypothetical protein PHISCL_08442 [Aspergillus sclerotialis]